MLKFVSYKQYIVCKGTHVHTRLLPCPACYKNSSVCVADANADAVAEMFTECIW